MPTTIQLMANLALVEISFPIIFVSGLGLAYTRASKLVPYEERFLARIGFLPQRRRPNLLPQIIELFR
jgi:hypothetical protein